MQRDVKRQMLNAGIGTKSQQALKLQQEQNKQKRKERSREEKEAEKQRMFDLKQRKTGETKRALMPFLSGQIYYVLLCRLNKKYVLWMFE